MLLLPSNLTEELYLVLPAGTVSLMLSQNDDYPDIKQARDYHDMQFLITTGPGGQPICVCTDKDADSQPHCCRLPHVREQRLVQQ